MNYSICGKNSGDFFDPKNPPCGFFNFGPSYSEDKFHPKTFLCFTGQTPTCDLIYSKRQSNKSKLFNLWEEFGRFF